MHRTLVALALLIALAAGVSACGKYGPPVRPEPAEQSA